MAKMYEVWAEGFIVTGQRGRAQLMGKIIAESFQEACDLVMSTPTLAHDYNKNNRSHWGRRLFDNEESARENFG